MYEGNVADHLTPKIGMYLFDSYVSPLLNYACELWCNLKELDCMYRISSPEVLKYILGIKATTCTLRDLGEQGRFPITVTQYVKLLKYWSHLVQIHNGKQVKKAFNVLCQLHNSGFETCATKVYNLL